MTYVITVKHHMYAPAKDVTGLACWDGATAVYCTRAEAVAALADLESGTYYTRHGESGRPTYQVRTVAGLPRYLATQL